MAMLNFQHEQLLHSQLADIGQRIYYVCLRGPSLQIMMYMLASCDLQALAPLSFWPYAKLVVVHVTHLCS